MTRPYSYVPSYHYAVVAALLEQQILLLGHNLSSDSKDAPRHFERKRQTKKYCRGEAGRVWARHAPLLATPSESIKLYFERLETWQALEAMRARRTSWKRMDDHERRQWKTLGDTMDDIEKWCIEGRCNQGQWQSHTHTLCNYKFSINEFVT